MLKTEVHLQGWARRMGRICLLGVLAGIAVVSLWTPLADPAVATRWFSWPNIAFLAPIPVLTALVAFAAWRVWSMAWTSCSAVRATAGSRGIAIAACCSVRNC
ncbi:hypothetical protein ACRAWG_36165 [Methylobacterium sp. P31]